MRDLPNIDVELATTAPSMPQPGRRAPVPIEALAADACRWPVSDRDGLILFCSAPLSDRIFGQGNRPYCLEHRLLDSYPSGGINVKGVLQVADNE
jgi:hypothetical protein